MIQQCYKYLTSRIQPSFASAKNSVSIHFLGRSKYVVQTLHPSHNKQPQQWQRTIRAGTRTRPHQQTQVAMRPKRCGALPRLRCLRRMIHIRISTNQPAHRENTTFCWAGAEKPIITRKVVVFFNVWFVLCCDVLRCTVYPFRLVNYAMKHL